MVIFPLDPDQTIAHMWSNGAPQTTMTMYFRMSICLSITFSCYTDLLFTVVLTGFIKTTFYGHANYYLVPTSYTVQRSVCAEMTY